MKASFALVLACVALAAATTRFERNNDQQLPASTQDFTSLISEDVNYMFQDKANEYNQKYNRHDCTKMRNFHKPQCQSYLKQLNDNTNQMNIQEYYDNYEQYALKNQRVWNQYGRSSEETSSDEQSDEVFEQYVRENDFTTSGTGSQFFKNIIDKFYSLYKIVNRNIKQSQGNIATLEMDKEVSLPMTIYKPHKDYFVRLHDILLTGLTKGHIEYLAINPENDNIYIEYKFKDVKIQSLYKSNLRHFNTGELAIFMKNVSSKASGGFHSRKVTYDPAKYEVVEYAVRDDRNLITEEWNSFLESNFLRDVKRIIPHEVFGGSHSGMLAELKTEITSPIEYTPFFGPGKLESMKWKQNNVFMELNNFKSTNNHKAHQKVNGMSYTHLNNEQYKMRFNSRVFGSEWMSDFVTAIDGQRYHAKNVKFNLKNIEIEFNVVKSFNTDECRMANVEFYLQGLEYTGLKEQLPTNIYQKVDQLLPRFIKYYLEAHMQKNLKSIFCENMK